MIRFSANSLRFGRAPAIGRALLPLAAALAAASLVICGAPERPLAADRFEATKALNRLKSLGPRDPKQVDRRLVILPVDDALVVPRLVESASPWLYDMPNRGPRIPGVISHAVLNEPGHPIVVAETELLALSEIEFLHWMRYLSVLRHIAVKLDAVPGPVHRGVALLLSHSMTSATEHVWTIDPEDAAIVYLIEALNGQPLDLSSLQLGESRKLDPAQKQQFGSQIRSALAQLVPGGSADDLASKLLEAAPSGKGKADRAAEFGLADVLTASSGAKRDDGAVDGARRERIERLVIAPVLNSPDRFRLLAARARLLRVARTVAAGRDAAIAASEQIGRPVKEGRLTAERANELQSFRRSARKLLEDEVQLRGGGPAVRGVNRMGYDPRAMAEVAGLMLADSVEFAKQIRIPVAEERNVDNARLLAGVERAFEDDADLKSFFKQHGRPTPRVEPAPGTPFGKALVLKWDVGPETNVIGKVELYLADSFSQGGSGLPIEWGILLTQPVLTSPQVPAADPQFAPLANAVPQQFVGAVAPFAPNRNDPPPHRRWYTVLQRKDFEMNVCVTVTAGARTVTGTPSQKILARRNSEAAWDWLELGTLREGDEAWIDLLGARGISGVRRTSGGWTFAQPVVAGTDHLSANGFLARITEEKITDTSKHGILQQTPVKAGADGHSESLDALRGKLDWQRRQFVQVPGVFADSKEVDAVRDLLVQLHPEPTRVIHWTVYQIDGATLRVGTNHSHGFLVSRGDKPMLTLSAAELVPGDRLYRDVPGDKPQFATVLSVGMEVAPEGRGWQLLHPKLLRCEWMGIQGIVLHTDTADLQPGVLDEVKIQLAAVKPGGPAGAAAPFTLGEQVEARQLRAAPVSAQGTWLDGAVQALLAADPGAMSGANPRPVFRPRVADAVQRTVVSRVREIVTENGSTLLCAPAQQVWREVGDPFARKATRSIQTVEARLVEEGLRILTLDAKRGVAQLSAVTSVRWRDAFDVNALGFFEVYAVQLAESPVPFIREHEQRFSTLFGNGVGVVFRPPGNQRDLWSPSSEPGPGPGALEGPAGSVVGALAKTAKVDTNPLTEAEALSLPARRQEESLLQFSVADYEIFNRSLERLNRATREFRKGELRLPAPGTETRGLLGAYLTNVLKRRPEEAAGICTHDNFEMALALYLDARADLLKERIPSGLQLLSRSALRVSYPLQASGGPGRLLLDDLLTIQMRLALRAQGEQHWGNETLGARPALLMAADFDSAVGTDGRNRGFAALMGARIDPANWVDLLLNLKTAEEINGDVLDVADGGNQVVFPYRLCIQMDHRLKREDLPSGLVFPLLDSNPGSGDLFKGLVEYLNRK